MTIPTLIIKEIVVRKLQKQAIRIAQRSIGANKIMGLVRRFDKKKTFVQNFKKKPYNMMKKMGKQFIARKILGNIPVARYYKNFKKYGMWETMKRCAIKATPTQLKIPFYFIKDVKNQYEKVSLILSSKKVFWQTLNGLSDKEKAKTLNSIVKFDPKEKELKDLWNEILNKEFMFRANSPMTENFSQLDCVYNIATKVLYLPIRGYGGTMIKTYKFDNIPWEYIYPAMKGADFGKRIYALFRSANADYYGKFWAPRDPHYN